MTIRVARTDGRTNGRRDGRTDGQTDRLTNLNNTNDDNEQRWWTTVVGFSVMLEIIFAVTRHNATGHNRTRCKVDGLLKPRPWNESITRMLPHLTHVHTISLTDDAQPAAELLVISWETFPDFCSQQLSVLLWWPLNSVKAALKADDELT